MQGSGTQGAVLGDAGLSVLGLCLQAHPCPGVILHGCPRGPAQPWTHCGTEPGTRLPSTQHPLPPSVPAVPGLTHTLCPLPLGTLTLPRPRAPICGSQTAPWPWGQPWGALASSPATGGTLGVPDAPWWGSALPAPQRGCAAPSWPPCRLAVGLLHGEGTRTLPGTPLAVFRGVPPRGAAQPRDVQWPHSTGLSGDGSADVSHFLHFFPHSSLCGDISGK